jgi:glycosyltransferase involved in cell wall biosynthesis
MRLSKPNLRKSMLKKKTKTQPDQGINAPMNILLLRPVLDAYGVTKILFQLAQQLRKNGHKITVISSNGEECRSILNWDGIKHYQIPIGKKNPISLVLGIFHILRIVQKEKITLINSHHRWASFLCLPVSKLSGIPLITTYHGLHEGKQFLSVWGKKIICVSKDAKNHLTTYFKVAPRKITIIHNGILLPQKVSGPIENKYSIPTGCPVIGCIARLSEEKDHGTLLKAMATIVKKHPGALLLLVGDGPLGEEIKKRVNELRLEKNVRFLGLIDDVANIYHHVHFTVLTSTTEGLPLCVLESLSFEKPVIATSVGDIPEVIIDGFNGLLIPPQNIDKLTLAMERLISNPAEAREMGINGRKTVEDRFSLDIMAGETEKEYRKQLKFTSD